MGTPPTAVVIDLGRTQGMGSLRRAASWRAVLGAAGIEVVDLALRQEHPVRPLDLLSLDLVSLARHRVVPESYSWSRRSLLRRIDEIDPDLVVCLTARCFHPGLARPGRRVVLDLVDRLSVSYRDRAQMAPGIARGALLRGLSRTAGRFEAESWSESVTVVAAGWTDARDLRATWIPNVAEPPPEVPDVVADTDLLFLGNLAYPPNAEAIERIATFWPRMERLRPGTTLMLAGANPSGRIRELVHAHGWRLVADFAELSAVVPRARLALVPISHASGIQSKVIDAAAYAVAQIVDPVVLAGMAPGFPAAVASDDEQFVDLAAELLEDPARMAMLGRTSRQHVIEQYSAETWAPWARGLLDSGAGSV